jgi:hypothetical protein
VVQASGQSWHSPSSGRMEARGLPVPDHPGGLHPFLGVPVGYRFLPADSCRTHGGGCRHHEALLAGTGERHRTVRVPGVHLDPVRQQRCAGHTHLSAWTIWTSGQLSMAAARRTAAVPEEKRGDGTGPGGTALCARRHKCTHAPLLLHLCYHGFSQSLRSGGAGEAPPDPPSARPMVLTTTPSPPPPPQAVRPAKLPHSLTEPSSLTVKCSS